MEFLNESRSKLCNTLRKVMSWIHARGSAVERIVAEAEATEQWKVLFLLPNLIFLSNDVLWGRSTECPTRIERSN